MTQINLFNRKVFFKDVVIMLLIVALPFLFYTYDLFPDIKVWKTKYFVLDSIYYEDINTLMWVLYTKILTFMILSIWFLTCKHWWRHAILIPIIIESSKIIIVANSDLGYVDHGEYLWSLPLTIPIILILLYLAKKLNYYSQSVNTSTELNEEINHLLSGLSIFKEDNFKSVKKSMIELRKQKNEMSKEEYLKKLIILRNNLTGL